MEELSASVHEAMHLESKADETDDVSAFLCQGGRGCPGSRDTNHLGDPGGRQGDVRQKTWGDPSGHEKEGPSLVGADRSQHRRTKVLGKYGAGGML